MTNILFVLYGPTCSGKTELSKLLIQTYGSCLRRIRSCTTRPRRVNRKDQPDESMDAYTWLSYREFEAQFGRFVEYDKFDGHLYGRRWEDFADLAKGPCFADMTESGLSALQGQEDFQVVSIRINPLNRKPDRRIEERAEDDARRALIKVRMDHEIENDHGHPDGLNEAFAKLRLIVAYRLKQIP